jgi:thiamine biosynthesis protein ThiC
MNKNLLTAAIAGEEVPVIDEVAKTEGVRPDFLRRQIASGRVAVMQRDGKPSYAPDFMTNAQR